MICAQITCYIKYGRNKILKEIIGVRFKKPGKIYFFSPKHNKVHVGQFVIVETSMGEEYAEVVIGNKLIKE